MALTLLEAAKKYAGDPIRSSIIELFPKNSSIFQFLQFESIQGGALKYNREDTLPGVGFRGVNEAYDESTGILNPQVESLAIAGGDLDVDKFILDTMGQDQRAVQEALKVKALAWKWTQAFFKGDSVANPRSFDGLQRRIVGTQLLDQGSTAGGDVLTLAKLDELLDKVDDPNVLFMNRTMRRRLTAAARTYTVGGFITYGVDAFGKQVTKYNEVPIIVIDKDNEQNEILPFTEAAASSTSQCTSIYACRLGDGGVMGLQSDDMSVRDLGEMQSKPVFRTRVEWFASFGVFSARSAARLRYVKDGAFTA